MRTVDPVQWSRTLKKVAATSEVGDNGLEERIRNALRLAFKEWLCYTTNSGWNKAIREGWLERIIVLFCFLCAVIISLLASSGWFGNGIIPLSIYPADSDLSADNLPFPAVAICSGEVLNKKMTNDFVDLVHKTPGGEEVSRKRVYKHIVNNYGALLNFDSPLEDEVIGKLILKALNETNFFFHLMNLTTGCEEMLVRCSWRGVLKSCKQLFRPSLTPSGLCCVFNSPLPKERLLSTRGFGMENGLGVVVSEKNRNKVYGTRIVDGMEVIVYPGRQYPLREGGGGRSFWSVKGRECYVSVKATRHIAYSHVKTMGLNKRRCKLDGEQSDLEPGEPNKHRSYAGCLAGCQRRSTLQLCNCVPFFLPHLDTDHICTPTHLPCLHKHRELFHYYYPNINYNGYMSEMKNNARAGLQEELQNAMPCEECVPDCEHVTYKFRYYCTPQEDGASIVAKPLVRGLLLQNLSTFNVFYSSNHHSLYTMEVTVRWFESVGMAFGCWTVLCGSYILFWPEFIYYLIARTRYYFKRNHPGRPREVIPIE